MLAVLALSGCLADEADDPTEDLGALDGKADKITTRNVTLRPHLASGAPSKRTFTVTTKTSFRVSLSYADNAAQTHLVVEDSTGVIAESPVTWQPSIVVPGAATSRQLKIRLENTAATSVAARLHAATPDGRTLRVATFNIRWYGLDGDVDAPKPEHRNPTIRAFMQEHLADADLIMFEEITDVPMLRTELMPDWSCQTYTTNLPKHQFVVGCVAPGLALTREADDDDIAYQPVGAGSLRPAIAGIVRDVATGAPLLRIAGVHLKALPDGTEKRLAQVKLLVDRLAAVTAAQRDSLPTLVLGDFNAHRAVDTHLARDDWDLMADVFATQPSLGLVHVEHTFENTYRDKDQKAYKLDHMWLGGATASHVEVAGPCNLPWDTGQATIVKHFDDVSDHCPVIATVTLP
jgi:endonuclease/exonuclease/phosphatase family metal-dependent hydrolase